MKNLTIKEFLKKCKEKFLQILIIILIALEVGLIYSYFIIKPLYTSTATLIIEGGINHHCDEVIKSEVITNQIIKNLNLEDITEKDIKKNINAELILNTNMVTLSYTDKDPNLAAKIINETIKLMSNKLFEIYNIPNLYTLDRGIPKEKPSNINHEKDIIISLGAGVFIAIWYILIALTFENDENIIKEVKNENNE